MPIETKHVYINNKIELIFCVELFQHLGRRKASLFTLIKCFQANELGLYRKIVSKPVQRITAELGYKSKIKLDKYTVLHYGKETE